LRTLLYAYADPRRPSPRAQVKRVEAPTKSIGGILLPESSVSKLNEGVVLSVGPGRRDKDGALIPMGVKPDDKVLLPQYGGSEVTIEEEELVLFRDDDILGVLKD
jgi:chaperonin GroES